MYRLRSCNYTYGRNQSLFVYAVLFLWRLESIRCGCVTMGIKTLALDWPILANIPPIIVRLAIFSIWRIYMGGERVSFGY